MEGAGSLTVREGWGREMRAGSEPHAEIPPSMDPPVCRLATPPPQTKPDHSRFTCRASKLLLRREFWIARTRLLLRERLAKFAVCCWNQEHPENFPFNLGGNRFSTGG